jgi:excisionase family DNA binding protein
MIEINLSQLESKLQELTETQAQILKILNSFEQYQQTPTRQQFPTENLLTTKEVCELFRVTRQSLAMWRKIGKIKAYKMNKTVRYKRSEINELLNIRSGKV